MICVLGVLKTEEGLRVKDEMLQWLRLVHDVYAVEQEAPGSLYEFPAMALAIEMCHKMQAPVLYLHTKGAANQHKVQEMVRKMWQGEFGNPEKMKEYLKLVDGVEPRLAAPVVGDESQTWFNGFIMNPAAATVLRDTIRPCTDRYYFECVARNTSVQVVSPRPPVDPHGAINFAVTYK